MKCVASTKGKGQYATAEECIQRCGGAPVPGTGFKCARGNCMSVAHGKGQYATFGRCKAVCGGSTKKKGLTSADIVGIVLGSAVVVAIIVTVSVLLAKKRHNDSPAHTYDE